MDWDVFGIITLSGVIALTVFAVWLNLGRGDK